MGIRKISEYLASGEAHLVRTGDLLVKEQQGFEAVQDPIHDGEFLRIQGGIVYTYRAADNDAEWIDSDTTDITLTTTPVEVLSVTVDQEITPVDGSYVISGKIDNTRNQELIVYLVVKDDGVEIGTEPIILSANEIGKTFAFAGALSNTLATGSVITVEFSGSFNNVLTLKGTGVPTKITLTKAGADPIVKGVTASGVEKIINVVLYSSNDFGQILGLSEIHTVFTENNIPPPTTTDFAFMIIDNQETAWLVRYVQVVDKFYNERLVVSR